MRSSSRAWPRRIVAPLLGVGCTALDEGRLILQESYKTVPSHAPALSVQVPKVHSDELHTNDTERWSAVMDGIFSLEPQRTSQRPRAEPRAAAMCVYDHECSGSTLGTLERCQRPDLR